MPYVTNTTNIDRSRSTTSTICTNCKFITTIVNKLQYDSILHSSIPRMVEISF